MARRALAACVLIACGSSGGDSPDAGPSGPKLDGSGFASDDPTTADTNAISASLAQNISISQISAYQVTEVPLATNGAQADRTIAGITGSGSCQTTADCSQPKECKAGLCTQAVKLIAKRAAVMRVFVTPGPGWMPASVTARVKIQLSGPSGTETRVYFSAQTVKAASSQGDLASTINIDLPSDALEPGAMFGVVLNQTGGGAATPTSPARYPMDGSLDDMAVVGGGDVIHLMIVPMAYHADGSGRLPDTSDAQLKVISDRFMQLYPTASFDLTVRAPFDWSQAITGGSGFDTALMAINALHGKDNAPSDVYYYGAFEPTPDFGSFCGGGCITGLSGIGPPASVGVGYPGASTAETMVHENGHAHGLSHAPGCGASGIPPMYWPTDATHTNGMGGVLGRWGYDSIGKAMVDPTTNYDMMSYCSPNWISDFHYMRVYQQVRGDNKFYSDYHGPVGHDEVPPYRGLNLLSDGTTSWDADVTTQGWVTRGEPRAVETTMADGTRVPQTGFYFPYDHLPGGLLMVPEQGPGKAVAVHALGLGLGNVAAPR